MIETPPERFKARQEWSVEEIVEHQRTGEVPETHEYRVARRNALADAGLEPGDDASGSTALEDLTADEHLERIRRAR